MRSIRKLALAVAALVLAASLAEIPAASLAASPAAAPGTTDAAPTVPEPRDVARGANDPAWSCSASLFGYFIPEDRDYGQPTLAADHGRWHLEARYNYEALKTGSAWFGYAFGTGKRLRLEVTPMVGGVFGDVHGVAPGYELTLGWSTLEFDSEGEYLFDAGDKSGDFFYNWSELSISPKGAWRAGIAVQRTLAYETSLDLQRGPLVGASIKQVDFTAYVFNLGWEDPTVVLSAAVNF